MSTSSRHIFEDDELSDPSKVAAPVPEERLFVSYEISRTINEIRKCRYKRIALQFPDRLLSDAPRVATALREGLKPAKCPDDANPGLDLDIQELDPDNEDEEEVRPYILGDTSYGACCVDEIAAEHINADVVVHYGRACLSPTARLPVIYVFVNQELDLEAAVRAFEKSYPDRQQKVILMGDVAYANYLPDLFDLLEKRGYMHLYATKIKHDPSSPIPNRIVPPDVATNVSSLAHWSLFHISSPPSSLLLLLASKVSNFYIHEPNFSADQLLLKQPETATSTMMRRRYALLLRASTAPIIGILLNTLSHKSLLPTLANIQDQIRAAGKKSYTFVVGKINPAKLANFAEVESWVIVGCWESELVEDDGFWRPMITPWELSVALQHENQRTWGQWESGWQRVLTDGARNHSEIQLTKKPQAATKSALGENESKEQDAGNIPSGDYDSEPESAPPEFDLRTGRYVSHSRPLELRSPPSIMSNYEQETASQSLVKRSTKTDLASIGDEPSPGARFLKEKRTWQGLGSDFQIAYDTREEVEGAVMEEGRRGVARGYVNPDTMVKT